MKIYGDGITNVRMYIMSYNKLRAERTKFILTLAS